MDLSIAVRLDAAQTCAKAKNWMHISIKTAGHMIALSTSEMAPTISAQVYVFEGMSEYIDLDPWTQSCKKKKIQPRPPSMSQVLWSAQANREGGSYQGTKMRGQILGGCLGGRGDFRYT
jgi:hypothetical protein